MAKQKTEKQQEPKYKKITLRIREDWLEEIENKKENSMTGSKESRNNYILRAIRTQIDSQ